MKRWNFDIGSDFYLQQNRYIERLLPSSSGSNEILIDATVSLWSGFYERFYSYLWFFFNKVLNTKNTNLFEIGFFIDVTARILWVLHISDRVDPNGINPIRNLQEGQRLLVADGLFTLLLEWLSTQNMQAKLSSKSLNYFNNILENEIMFPSENYTDLTFKNSTKDVILNIDYSFIEYHKSLIKMLNYTANHFFSDNLILMKKFVFVLNRIGDFFSSEITSDLSEVADVDFDEYLLIIQKLENYGIWLSKNGYTHFSRTFQAI